MWIQVRLGDVERRVEPIQWHLGGPGHKLEKQSTQLLRELSQCLPQPQHHLRVFIVATLEHCACSQLFDLDGQFAIEQQPQLAEIKHLELSIRHERREALGECIHLSLDTVFGSPLKHQLHVLALVEVGDRKVPAILLEIHEHRLATTIQGGLYSEDLVDHSGDIIL